MRIRYSRGFTLIELLVVISIISLLSSVVLSSLNNARTRARDTKRMLDIKQMVNALEIYRTAVGNYPSTSGNWQSHCSGYGGYALTGSGGYIPNLAPTYMSVLPMDPKYNGSGGCYLYRSDGTDYKILAHGTTESVCPVPSTHPFYDPVRAGQCTFQFSTSGAVSW